MGCNRAPKKAHSPYLPALQNKTARGARWGGGSYGAFVNAPPPPRKKGGVEGPSPRVVNTPRGDSNSNESKFEGGMHVDTELTIADNLHKVRV